MGCGSSSARSSKASTGKKKMPTLYIWPGSAPCRAVLMTSRAAGVEIDIKILDVFKQEHKTNKFKKINPEGSIPTLVDEDFIVCKSRPMMKAIVDKYTKGHTIYPAEIELRCLVDKYLEFDEENVYPAVSQWIYPQVFAAISPDSKKRTAVCDVLDELNNLLSMRSHIAGEHVTLADLSVMSTVSLLELLDWDFMRWPAVTKWRRTVKELEYYASCNKGLEDWKYYLHYKKMSENEE